LKGKRTEAKRAKLAGDSIFIQAWPGDHKGISREKTEKCRSGVAAEHDKKEDWVEKSSPVPGLNKFWRKTGVAG